LTRPGEAIFNDAGGLVEGNQPFQVAWIDSDLQREQLIAIAAKHQAALAEYGRPLVFEGNRHSIWSEEVASAVIADNTGTHKAFGLLGEAVRIGPPTTLKLTDQTGRNVLCVADSSSIESVLATWLPTAVAEVRSRLGAAPEIVYFEGRRNEGAEFSLSKWLTEVGIIDRVIHPRDCLVEINRLMAMLTARNDSPDEYPPVFVVIAELERFRDLRQDESFGFSLDSSETVSGGASLQKLLSDGPPIGIHVVITCNSSETLTRWLPRTSQHDLELRIVGRISANDSAQLIDTPEASSLAPASMYMYDDADGRLEKFRLCEIPEVQRVKKWLGNW
jgi:S-DNA-T family DNA segregation ATPase FtsK/SpoIIIE